MMNNSLAHAIANPAQLKLPDPMEQMGGFLTNALMMEKIQAGRQERMDNALANEAWKAAGGDKTKVMTELINRGQGSKAPGLMKQFAEIEDKEAGAAKTQNEAILKSLEFTRQFLPAISTPQEYVDVMFKEPTLGPHLTKQFGGPENLLAALSRLTPEQFGKFKEQQMAGVENSLKNHYQVIGEKDKQSLVAVPEYGTAKPQVVKTFGPKPETGTTVNIDNRAVGEFEKERLKIQAQEDADLAKAAENAPALLEAFTRAQGLIPRAYTGKLANVQLGGNAWSSALNIPIGSDDARIATQELSMFLDENSLKNVANLINQGVKLGAVTKPEFDKLMGSAPKLTDDPAVINSWIEQAKGMLKRTIDKAQARHKQIGGSPAKGLNNVVPQPPQVPGGGQPPGPPAVPGASSGVFIDKDGDPIPMQAIEEFRKNRNNPTHRKSFEKAFGPAAAAQVLGGTSTGGAPFPQ